MQFRADLAHPSHVFAPRKDSQLRRQWRGMYAAPRRSGAPLPSFRGPCGAPTRPPVARLVYSFAPIRLTSPTFSCPIRGPNYAASCAACMQIRADLAHPSQVFVAHVVPELRRQWRGMYAVPRRSWRARPTFSCPKRAPTMPPVARPATGYPISGYPPFLPSRRSQNKIPCRLVCH